MFSSTYVEAREKFKTQAQRLGLQLDSYVMDQKGPHQESLSTDVGSFVSVKTKKLLIINSGIHGIEGFFGSAMQSQLLSELDISKLPEDLGIILIHASNPYGFAYSQRVDASETKEGKKQRVDPNRNFVDFRKELPSNPQYLDMESTIIPEQWTFWSTLTTTALLLWSYLLDEIMGTFSNFSIPVLGGQYVSPDGFSFGGTSPSWTNRVLNQVISKIELMQNLEEIVFIDLHTGIGKKGTIEIYPNLLSDNCFTRVSAALDKISDVEVKRAPYPVTGALDDAMQGAFPGKKITSFTLECGTCSPIKTLNALREQNVSDRYHNCSAEEVERNMRDAFYPDDSAWRNKVASLTRSIFTKVFTHLLRINLTEPLVKLSDKKCSMFPAEMNKQKERVLESVAYNVKVS